MLDQSRFSQIDQKRAHLFTERYQDLLAWALRLTNQNRASAEDLVQDAFVQFVLARPSLQQIQNIDGYLRRILLYMHFSRINGLERRLNDATLSIADDDSIHFGWPAIEPSRRMQVVEELHQICAYVCWRKESSRAGSVLILRFFHDYLPSEIAAVLKTTRHCVDQWQRLARQEARHRRFENDKSQENTWRLSSLPSGCDLKVELRKMIFNSRRGECLSRRDLEEIYLERHKRALTAKKLAHIVSCQTCLDAVNSFLGLTLLRRRYQIESPGL